ncbi:MAG: hypothetical protein RMM28_02075 [Thermoleophilia bacterium]|nr:hypothetical protein [Thermoleophilia bacterium]
MPEAIGLASVDRLTELAEPELQDYVVGVSEYVREHARLSPGKAKAAQIRLSAGLGRALVRELRREVPGLSAVTGEQSIAGALRTVKADVSESNDLDGLRLAVEIKPVNVAVGRALWNRFGDIRTFAVNLHLKFPFAVVGGVLVIPTYEENRGSRRDTRHLIHRAVQRLVRAGGRRSEGDAPHLLEGVCVLVYDPGSASLDRELPVGGSGLRWEEFVRDLAHAYQARFDT